MWKRKETEMKKYGLLLGILLPCVANAANTETLGVFDNWSAYKYQDETEQVCYMSSIPVKSEGKYTRRDDVFLIVTHRPQAKSYDVVNVVAGYTYKSTSKPQVTIDKNKAIELKRHENTAWAKDAATDAQLVAEMKKGRMAVLMGTSARGTKTTDTFYLTGFSKAYEAINKACGRE